jgi:hypothetical protein
MGRRDRRAFDRDLDPDLDPDLDLDRDLDRDRDRDHDSTPRAAAGDARYTRLRLDVDLGNSTRRRRGRARHRTHAGGHRFEVHTRGRRGPRQHDDAC